MARLRGERDNHRLRIVVGVAPLRSKNLAAKVRFDLTKIKNSGFISGEPQRGADHPLCMSATLGPVRIKKPPSGVNECLIARGLECYGGRRKKERTDGKSAVQE